VEVVFEIESQRYPLNEQAATLMAETLRAAHEPGAEGIRGARAVADAIELRLIEDTTDPITLNGDGAEAVFYVLNARRAAATGRGASTTPLNGCTIFTRAARSPKGARPRFAFPGPSRSANRLNGRRGLDGRRNRASSAPLFCAPGNRALAGETHLGRGQRIPFGCGDAVRAFLAGARSTATTGA
jgi:hypothetical protein